MTIETPTLAQDATWQLGVGYLDTRPFVLPSPGASSAGVFRFTGLTRSQLLTGPLDQAGVPTPESGRPNTLRYRSATFSLAQFNWPDDSLPCTLELYALRTTPAVAWSTPNAPAMREQNAVVNAPQLDAALQAGDAALLASQLYAVSAPVLLSLNLGALYSIAQVENWDGTLNLWLVGRNFPAGATGVTFVDSTLDGSGATLTFDVDTQDLTGLVTDRNGWLGRARRCNRCGRPKVSDDFVRDGETRTYVCADCYDIRQVPRNTARGEKPPVKEG